MFRSLPKALAGHEESIHLMRVAGRRLRVALPLLARKADGKRVRRALRGLRLLTRAASGSRDLDVSVALLDGRFHGMESPGPERRTLRRRLGSARGRGRKRMAEALMDLEIARLRRDLRVILARKGEGLFVVLLRLKQNREEGGAALLADLEAVGDRFDPEALHRIRIRCRRLRYAAEVSDALKGQPSEAPDLFKELQERLGRVHDAFVLARWLGAQAATAQIRGQATLAAAAREEEAALLEASREHHRAFLDMGPADLVRRGMEAMGGARSAA